MFILTILLISTFNRIDHLQQQVALTSSTYNTMVLCTEAGQQIERAFRNGNRQVLFTCTRGQ